MRNKAKRVVPILALAVVMLGPVPAQAAALEWVGAGPMTKVYDPGTRYLNDHSIIKGHDGLWHLYSITGNNPAPGTAPNSRAEDFIAHATAPAMTGPWTTRAHVLQTNPAYHGEDHLWAPHVIFHNGTYYMFYAAGLGDNAAINLATSTDLYTWSRIPSGPLFRDIAEARDPMVTRVGSQWVMYYTTTVSIGGRYAVAYRTSTDLIHWSGRQIAYSDLVSPPSAPTTESPFVVQRNGWWYLFIGPRNGYTGTDVFRSTDPFRFNLADLAGHVPAHAPELVQDGTTWWFTHVGWWQRGMSIGRLNWQGYAPIWHNRSNPTIVPNADGRLEAFAVKGTTNRIVHRWQTSPNGSWSAWEDFGAVSGSAPSVHRHADGRIIVFSIAPDGSYLGTRSQVARSGAWGPWEIFGGPAGAVPAIGKNKDGRLEIFVLGPMGKTLMHRWQVTPNGGWSNWATFGTAFGAPPAVASNADGRLEVFAPGPAGEALYNRYQLAPNGAWSNWEVFGGPTAQMTPTVGRNADGRLEVFALGPYGAPIANKYQLAPSGRWSAWEHFGPNPAGAVPTVANNKDGRLEVIAVGPGNDYMSHRWQLAPSGGWSQWEGFGGSTPCPPSVGVQADGRLMAITMTPALNGFTHKTQAAPSGSWLNWAGFVAPGGPLGNYACGQAS